HLTQLQIVEIHVDRLHYTKYNLATRQLLSGLLNLIIECLAYYFINYFFNPTDTFFHIVDNFTTPEILNSAF
ncbi:unnamed protein product, partial [marine sediment metagenome]